MTEKSIQLSDRIEELEEALHRIVQWSEAYPPDIFPKPDWKKAQVLLQAGGMTLDSISGTIMRDMMVAVGEIAKEALGNVR